MKIALWVKPNSTKVKIGGTHQDALIVAVKAPAKEGKANDEVIKVLAKQLGIRKADVTIRSGLNGRNKIVELPDECQTQITRLKNS